MEASRQRPVATPVLPDVPVDAASTGPRGQPCNVHVRSSESQFPAHLFKVSVAVACYINNVTKAARFTMLGACSTAWLDSRGPPQARGQPCLCTDTRPCKSCSRRKAMHPAAGGCSLYQVGPPRSSGLPRGHHARSLSHRDGGHAAGGSQSCCRSGVRGLAPFWGH